jgi:hypothetical protein
VFLYNKYYRIYMNLVKRGQIDRSLEFKEIHHIIPKSMGGKNIKENLTELAPREHLLVHRLLTKITTGRNKSKMHFALWRMINSKGYKITSRTYELLRESHSEFLRNYQTGRTWKQNNAAKEKARLRSTGEKNNMFGKKHSEKTKRIISEKKKGTFLGEKNPFHNKTHSEKTRNRILENNKKEYICPCCGKKGKGRAMKRWHFDKCRQISI